MEEEMKQMVGSPESTPSSTDTMCFSSQHEDQKMQPKPLLQHVVLKREVEAEAEEMVCEPMLVPKQENSKAQLPIKDNKKTCGTSLQLPFGKDKIPELQMPMMVTDWTQDTFWAQLNSPWLQNLTYSNILNF